MDGYTLYLKKLEGFWNSASAMVETKAKHLKAFSNVDLFLFQVEEVKKMKIGDPLDRSTDHGPQNHKAHLDKLVEYCQTGVTEGATLVCGGKQVQRAGRPGSPAATFSTLRRGCWHHSGVLLCLQAFSLSPRCSLTYGTTCTLLGRNRLAPS